MGPDQYSESSSDDDLILLLTLAFLEALGRQKRQSTHQYHSPMTTNLLNGSQPEVRIVSGEIVTDPTEKARIENLPSSGHSKDL